jgi:hypothetical protein
VVKVDWVHGQYEVPKIVKTWIFVTTYKATHVDAVVWVVVIVVLAVVDGDALDIPRMATVVAKTLANVDDNPRTPCPTS